MSNRSAAPADPEMFLFRPEDTAGGERVTLSFRRTPTVLLTFAANRFTRAASRLYQRRFGIGAMDWRMLVMLAREPGSGVSHAGRTIGIDKGAVSRSLQRLAKRGLVEATDGPPNRPGWRLTDAGGDLHDRILDLAMTRQGRLLDGFSEDEIRAFNDYLQRFLSNLDRLKTEDASDEANPKVGEGT